MHDFLNAGARRGDRRGELGDTARPVGHLRRKPPEPAVGRQTMLDHAVEDREIDVAAAEQEHDPAAGKLLTKFAHHCGQRRCRGPFHDGLLEFEESQHGERDRLFADGHHAIDKRRGDRERQGPDLAHREAIGEGRPRGHLRRPACRQRCAQAAGRGGLDGNDLDVGPEALGHGGHAGQEARPSGGHDDHLGVGHIFENLQGHGPLPRDHAGVVEAVHEVQAVAFGHLDRQAAGVVKRVALENDPGAEFAAGGHLHNRCKPRHHNGDRDA